MMKREKSIKELKNERPRRVVVSEKEALKRMEGFSKRKEQFLATANNRLARESAKLNKGQQQELADEGWLLQRRNGSNTERRHSVGKS